MPPIDAAANPEEAVELLDRVAAPALVQDDKETSAPDGERERAIAIVKEHKLDKEGKSIERIERLAKRSGRGILEETKYQLSLVKVARGNRAKKGKPVIPETPPTGHGIPSTEPPAGRATAKGFRAIRSVETLQNLLAKEQKERRAEREAAAERDRELTARLARLEVQSTEQTTDDLTTGLAGLLGFIFDGVSEWRRATFAAASRELGRNGELDQHELAAVSSWVMSKERAAEIAKPFAAVLARHMGEEWIDMLPLLVGIAGIGAHVMNGVRADRLALAEPGSFRIERGGK